MIFALAAAAQANAAPQLNAPVQSGRFQIFFSPHARGDTFLVDTQTGKVWQLIKFTDVRGEPTVWDRMDRLDDDAQTLRFLRQHGAKDTENSNAPDQ